MPDSQVVDADHNSRVQYNDLAKEHDLVLGYALYEYINVDNNIIVNEKIDIRGKFARNDTIVQEYY